DAPKRMPSLRSVSEPDKPHHPMSASSTPLGVLSSARRPPVSSGMSSGRLPDGLNAKMKAFHLSRQGSSPLNSQPNAASPQSPVAGIPMSGPSSGGLHLPGTMQRPGAPSLQRPGAPAFPHSMPQIPVAGGGGLAGKRKFGLKLSNMTAAPEEGAGAAPGASLTIPGGLPQPSSQGAPSQMKQFEEYIDSERGYLTFKGKAIITNEGVNFSDGSVFKMSLDEVEKLDELGKGNYGVVYKVRHSKPRLPRFGPGLSGFKSSHIPGPHVPTDTPDSPTDSKAGGTSGLVMAMKEIRLELDEAKLSTILKELVILHECASPYIIDFYGAFFQESAVYMCIEYMDGGSIDKLYAGGVPENVLRKITYCTVMGLKELKDKHNIIHRDVKPTNILVNSRGQVKICDFGVSGNLVASIARTNIGCQSYMAPERIHQPGGASDGTYSVQSDIWSLGLTIIEMAMGHYPYTPAQSVSIFAQISAIVHEDPPKMPEEGYSATAHKFVKSCLNKNANLRPTYQALLNAEWIKDLTKPETITEEDEEDAENEASAEAIANAANNMDVSNSGTEDPEVAAWVQDVLAKKTSGQYGEDVPKPALHAAPLDAAA
ncbi:kinase-like domain-containing protein, partial [Truncatella angustata]